MKRQTLPSTRPVELVVAPAAIERAIEVYEQLQTRDTSVLLQARKILTQYIFGMVDQGELDERRLTVGGLVHLKAIERDHATKSARGKPKTPGSNKASSRHKSDAHNVRERQRDPGRGHATVADPWKGILKGTGRRDTRSQIRQLECPGIAERTGQESKDGAR